MRDRAFHIRMRVFSMIGMVTGGVVSFLFMRSCGS